MTEEQKQKREYKLRSKQDRLDSWMKKIAKWESMEQKRILKIGRARQIAQHLTNAIFGEAQNQPTKPEENP